MTEKQLAQMQRNRLRNMARRGKRKPAPEPETPQHVFDGLPFGTGERLGGIADWLRLHPEQAQQAHEANRAAQRPRERAYARHRRATDDAFRLLCSLRSRLRAALKAQRATRVDTTTALCGCTLAQLLAHIEVQFLPGMTWENHGAWHIDHKRPCAAFDLLNPEQQRACFHFSNLQPLWAADNFAKSSRY